MGRVAWRTARQGKDACLPLPSDEAVLAAARKLLGERLAKLGKLPPDRRRAEQAVLEKLAADYEIPF